MQKYLTPAKRYIGRVTGHPADFRDFVQKRRALVYGVAVTILLVITLGSAVIKGNMNRNNDAFTHETQAKGNSVTTTVTNDGTSPISDGSNISNGKTNVIVNDQSINVPQNGSVSKTITNDDGSTTHVNVSHNSSNSGDSTSSSASSSTNISTNTYSKSVNLHSP